ncbi:MAG TPA: tRNA pseudouridine(55) synthase TruB, partial [Blastocatellia bacterium]|nr:tRNA pseudouridine(55) synthase TruB [Blastocatellia bacterium]
VGHAGTLDPFATGVLIVCIGRATRLVQFLVHLEKEYIARVRVGYSTDTQDLTGERITPIQSSQLSLEQVRTVVESFQGPQLQLPPMFSAKKVAGERLYKAARAGREVERQAVRITVHSIELMEPSGGRLAANDDGTIDFDIRVRCSSGTYIRTIAHDLGARLGVGAHLIALRRTRVGQAGIDRATRLEELERLGSESSLESRLISPSETVGHLPVVILAPDEVGFIVNGRAVEISGERGRELNRESRAVRICDAGGRLVAVGETDHSGSVLRPRIVLATDP